MAAHGLGRLDILTVPVLVAADSRGPVHTQGLRGGRHPASVPRAHSDPVVPTPGVSSRPLEESPGKNWNSRFWAGGGACGVLRVPPLARTSDSYLDPPLRKRGCEREPRVGPGMSTPLPRAPRHAHA